MHEYGEDGEKHDFWEEPDRRRHWFPVLKEMIVTDGDQPPHGLRGTRYMAVGEAATKLLWRRPLHQVHICLSESAVVAMNFSPEFQERGRFLEGRDISMF